ncbi:response regulator (plasmid) [Rhizobium sp. 32-5/1]|uniref:response regulator n=1 Tax=Rhizobium sp. 32-5/1 TaxID=3019602 RepID=UPI00240E0675|nr:response regulator [Rhizobium sp. 32-5/1]WEZ86001.1 response regulator [Rhizobium sp. 32-5/1]
MNSLLADRRILVVEDETMILLMIEEMLDELGCRNVTSAGTVEKALLEIETRTFDGAMLDMNLHGIDSCPVADSLASHGVPFIYSTGNCYRETRDGFCERDVLRKPFSFDQLTSALTGLLPRSSG